MRIAVLGPLEVLTDELAPVVVPGAKERLLLAVLTRESPGVVSTDRLTEALWNGARPAAAQRPSRLPDHMRAGRSRAVSEP
ncbi:hypothetical protein E4P40_05855 [Blastococcus sp. CT_GayMR20]|uniref:hypothetical protein n=1 Tax=Blastococcus sp. CT_GayMR20 TaxID=2559609 RepID=UPI0010734894|nr:hypothetical protein [Blastococcus sp. CT_GayMR20]TFV91551.1 hypothetical protein E4P40_05855 [Blastococcus sp. CT_GayMR20]